jgi:hypothetical protein
MTEHSAISARSLIELIYNIDVTRRSVDSTRIDRARLADSRIEHVGRKPTLAG